MDEIEVLLSMHGEQVHRDDGYWWKIEAWTVPPTKERPQGTLYEFSDCYTLLQDFFEGIDRTIAVIEGK